MSNLDRSVIGFLLIGLMVLMLIHEKNIKQEINNINQINENICEELLPYKFTGRQFFVCLNEDSSYSAIEWEVINEWKSNR